MENVSVNPWDQDRKSTGNLGMHKILEFPLKPMRQQEKRKVKKCNYKPNKKNYRVVINSLQVSGS